MKGLFLFVLSLFAIQVNAEQTTCDFKEPTEVKQWYEILIGEHAPNQVDAFCLGSKLAQRDSAQGLKQILRYYGPNSNGCLDCAYHQFGFSTIRFAADDILYASVNNFMNAYNQVMRSMLTVEQRQTIDSSGNHSPIFTPEMVNKNRFLVKSIDKNTVRLTMIYDTLQSLFKDDIRFIQVTITYSIKDSNPIIINYADLKSKGALIEVGNRSQLKLHFTFDFSLVPNNYVICWCHAPDKEYKLFLAVNRN